MIVAFVVSGGRSRRLAVRVGVVDVADLLRLAAVVGVAALVRPVLPMRLGQVQTPLPSDAREAIVTALAGALVEAYRARHPSVGPHVGPSDG